MDFGTVAFGIGRRIGKHPAAGWQFCATERLLPIDRTARANCLVAFHHPRPTANPHILIVPTKPFPTLTTNRLKVEKKSHLIWQMVQMAREIHPGVDRQMIINGGERQEVGQVHAHVVNRYDTGQPGGHELQDPATDIAHWTGIFATLEQANSIPGNGFSLVTHWNERDEPMFRITQSSLTD